MDDQNKADQPLEGSEPPAAPAPEPAPAPAPAPAPVATPAQPQAPQQPGVTQPQPPQPGQPYAQAAPQYYQPVAPQSSGKAIGALVCGIFAILFCALPLIGIVLGIVAIVLAGKAVKEAGKDGKATGGKVCGIIGIVFSVLAFVAYVALGIGIATVIASDPDVSAAISSSSAPSAPSAPEAPEAPAAPSASSDSEAAMQSALSAELDKVKGKDSALMQRLASELDEGLADATGYGLAELGVDPTSFAEWMLADFDYEVGSALDYGDGTGFVLADVTLRDSMAFATTFMEDAQAAIDAGEMDAMDEAGAKARLGELYKAAMDKTTTTTTDSVSVDMIQSGDTWKVDPDSWESEMDYLFGLY